MPLEKISSPVANTSASSVNATTTSIRVNPRSVRNRHPPGEPVDVDEILALTERDRDAAAGGAAVGIEADGRALVALDFRLRGEKLELEPLGQLVRLRFA